jgi:hypothetical protein
MILLSIMILEGKELDGITKKNYNEKEI